MDGAGGGDAELLGRGAGRCRVRAPPDAGGGALYQVRGAGGAARGLRAVGVRVWAASLDSLLGGGEIQKTFLLTPLRRRCLSGGSRLLAPFPWRGRRQPRHGAVGRRWPGFAPRRRAEPIGRGARSPTGSQWEPWPHRRGRNGALRRARAGRAAVPERLAKSKPPSSPAALLQAVRGRRAVRVRGQAGREGGGDHGRQHRHRERDRQGARTERQVSVTLRAGAALLSAPKAGSPRDSLCAVGVPQRLLIRSPGLTALRRDSTNWN